MRRYSERYDAYYDDTFNLWCEPRCSDADCWYCKDRPYTPVTTTASNTVALVLRSCDPETP